MEAAVESCSWRIKAFAAAPAAWFSAKKRVLESDFASWMTHGKPCQLLLWLTMAVNQGWLEDVKEMHQRERAHSLDLAERLGSVVLIHGQAKGVVRLGHREKWKLSLDQLNRSIPKFVFPFEYRHQRIPQYPVSVGKKEWGRMGLCVEERELTSSRLCDETCIHRGSVRDRRFWIVSGSVWQAMNACASDTRRVEAAAMECCGIGVKELNQGIWTMVSVQRNFTIVMMQRSIKRCKLLLYSYQRYKCTHLLCRYYGSEPVRGWEVHEVENRDRPILERRMLFQ